MYSLLLLTKAISRPAHSATKAMLQAMIRRSVLKYMRQVPARAPGHEDAKSAGSGFALALPFLPLEPRLHLLRGETAVEEHGQAEQREPDQQLVGLPSAGDDGVDGPN